MSDIMGGAGGSGNIRVDVILAARNATTVSRQLARLKTDLASIAKANRTLTGGMGASAGGSALRNERMEAQRLGVALRRAAQEAKSYGRAASVGVSTAGKSRQQIKQDIKAFHNLQKAAGTAIVGNPQNFALLRKNFRTLATDSKNANLAGIASLATMRTMQDGIARAGNRGFTAFERFRVQTFALRKDFSSVGTGMMNLGKQTSWLGRTMMLNLTLPLTAFAASASREFLKVQSQFFQLKKVMEFKMKDGVTIDPVTNLPNAAEMKSAFAPLKREIRALSEELGTSQAVITGVFRDVAALGFDTDEVIEGWSRGIAQIATIGDIDFSTATEFFRSSNALFAEGDTQIEKLAKTNELMAQFNAISDETSLQLKDLADAFPEVAPVMQNFGFQAAEIGSALAGMFKLGIPSSEAAHALKFGFQRTVGFKNTRERISSLGVSFFDEQGMAQLGQGRKAIFELASALDSLGNEERQKAIGEITGARQTARWGIYFRSVIEGERQLQAALADRKLTAEELSEIDSDYMRGLLASGEIKRQFEEAVRTGAMRAEDMPDLSVLDDPVERYKIAMAAYKEDPATKWNIMITTIKNALIDVGEFIVPIITTWGTKLGQFFQKLANMPDTIKKIAGGMGVLAAAVGGVIVAFGAMTTLAGSGFKVLSKLIPRMGVRNIMPDKAQAMLQASPGRQDIGRVGNRYMHFKSGGVGAKHTPVTGLSEMQRLSGVSKGANASMSELNSTIRKGDKQLASYAAAGMAGSRGVEKGMNNVRVANQNAQQSVNNLNEANRAYFDAHNRRAQNARKIRNNQYFPGEPMSQAQRRAKDNVMIAPTGALATRRRQAQQEAALAAEVSSKEQEKAAKKFAKQQAKNTQKLRRSAMFASATTGAALAQPFKLAAIGMRNHDIAEPVARSVTRIGRLGQSLKSIAKGFVSPFRGIRNAAISGSGAITEGFTRAKAATLASSAALADKTSKLKATQLAAVSAAAASSKRSNAAEAALIGGVGSQAVATRSKQKAVKDASAASKATSAVLLGSLLKPFKLLKIAAGGIGVGLKLSLPVIIAAGAKILLIIGAVTAAVGAVGTAFYVVYKTISESWDKIKERIKGPLTSMEDAIQRVKNAIKNLVDVVSNTLKKTLFKENENPVLDKFGGEAEKQSNAWETAADAISVAVSIIAWGIDLVASAIEKLAPLFSWLAEIVATTIGFIANIIQGNWSAVMAYFVKSFYVVLSPIIWIAEKILDIFVWLVERILWLFKQMGKGVGFVVDRITAILPNVAPTNIAESVEQTFQSIQNATSKFRNWDLTGGLGRRIDDWLDSHKFELDFSYKPPKVDRPAAKKAGDEAADAFNQGLGDNAGKGVGPQIAKNLEDDILKNFLDVLKSRVRKEMDKIREELEKAFEKNKEKKLKAYDDQIKAIEKLEKADEKRYRTEEYLERRREIMTRRDLDRENYKRNRALAVYENRVYDIRSLDLDNEQNMRDSTRELVSLEKDRSRALLSEMRDLNKERLREQQEAEQKRLDRLEESFKKQLDLIFEYEPRTVEEFGNMLGKLSKLTNDFGIAWPASIKTSGEHYLEALKAANNQIVQEFGWGGERGIMAWVMPFISSAARSILMEKAFDMGRDVGQNYQRGMDSAGGGLPGGGGSGGGLPGGDAQLAREEAHKAGSDAWSKVFKTLILEQRVLNKPKSVKPGELSEGQKTLLKRLMQERLAPHEGSTGMSVEQITGVADTRVAGEGTAFGFLNGFTSEMSGHVDQQVRNAINKHVVQPTLQELGIRSPSRVFDAIGRQTAEGLGNGLFRAALSIPGRLISALASLPARLLQWLGQSFRNLITAFPGFAVGLVSQFATLPGRLVGAAAGLGGRLIRWAGEAFTSLRGNLPNAIGSVASWFSGLPGVLVSRIGSLAGQLFTWATNSFVNFTRNLPQAADSLFRWFGSLPGRLWEGLRNQFRNVNPLVGAGWNLVKGMFGFHTGGIVGEKNDPAKLTGRPNEVFSVLLKGEGVLPVSAMNKIGPQGFEMLRRGALGGAVAMMASGAVSARAPRMASMPSPSRSSRAASGGDNGDVYIHVDTFIGEEQWFKSMADKYDMKVSSRKAKNTGSPSRLISSYNVNDRNSYR